MADGLSWSPEQASSAFGKWWNDNIDRGGSVGNWILDPFDLGGKRAAANQAATQYALQKDAQMFNSAEAERQRQWEAEMSNSAVQRQVADIKAAGLNPWLALNGGQVGGSSTPSGSSATSSQGSVDSASNKTALIAGVIATALRMFLTKGK
jgi:hypothetical protein